jgi:hypothetical protein
MHFVEAPTNFYMGARVDPATNQVIEDDIVYYDSRNLTTHGVILGMTGSGKTGLGITLLEEAVIDGIPTLIIDPKGDITNMLLAFPELTAEYFEPWISPEDALRDSQPLADHARSVAEMWKNGLEAWGITNDRIQDYRRAARFSIYTPGSTAGLPVSILQSFAAPRDGWEGQEELLRERISGTVTALLALVGISARPVESREHILLSNILEYNWRNGVDLTLEQMIVQVQEPPFDRLGVLDVEEIFPAKDRARLAKMINNIIAAPNFHNWIQGEPIDIPALLFTGEGIPRCSIFYVAHLNDAERQFIITLLLEGMRAWMASQSGSTSLRALVYIDEVFGMIPPYPRNPPTKEPIMRLLKEGRAFGVGTVLATQNPKDLDYKGLSNTGTWFIGKMQTEHDKERVLEGLDTTRDATSVLDISSVGDLITNLGPRQFLMHNVHEQETPILMHTRWAMSYLSGPLTREQVSRLMDNQRDLYQAPKLTSHPSYFPTAAERSAGVPAPTPAAEAPAAPAPQAAPRIAAPDVSYPPPGSSAGTPAPTYTITQPETPVKPPEPAEPAGPTAQPARQSMGRSLPPGFMTVPPELPDTVRQFYLPTEYTVERAIRQWESWMNQPASSVQTHKRLLYRPSLLAQCVIRYQHKSSYEAEALTYAFVVPNVPRLPFLEWGEFHSEPFDPYTLDSQPFAEALYADIPEGMTSKTSFKELQTNLEDWLYHNTWLTIYYNSPLNLYSGLHEDLREFQSRVHSLAREGRDEEVDKVAARYDSKLAALEDRARKRSMRLEQERQELGARKSEEMLGGAETVMRLFGGRRSYYALSRTSRLRRYANMSESQVGIMEQDVQDILDQMDQTEQEMQNALQTVQDKWADITQQIEEVRVTPYKKDINMMVFGVGWVPYWDVQINNSPVILPASSSGLSVVQDPNIDEGFFYNQTGGGGYYA